ncbi:hypothetical protein [Sphingobacterium siyangense]|uniref:hypothetical protein n=1 Tax=Sphingobacterium siyangense TaxID=459529 RepID=UPI003DA4DD9A
MKTFGKSSSEKRPGPLQSIRKVMAGTINKKAEQGAAYLKKKTAHYSPRTWKMLLAAFILVGSAICIYIIVTAIYGTVNQSFNF